MTKKKTIAELEGVPAERVRAPEPKTQRAQTTRQAEPPSPLDGIDNATINRALDLAGQPGIRADELARRCGITVEAARAVIECARHEASERRAARGRRRLFAPPTEQEISGLPRRLDFLDKWWGPR